MSMENRSKDDTTTQGNDSSAVPSGFILKLYQMVNGAPDEVISWTPLGDAFIIGSDLVRLESETLPQYFRHNRFQSLVRQLNFYSFRKINRERNVWIYKHKLFHRDRPEDLHMVRRRTCPGVDGRKQRFSRYSAQKISNSDKAIQSSDDEHSLGSSSDDENESKKRSMGESRGSESKRSRRSLWYGGGGNSKTSNEKKVVDATSVVKSTTSPTSVYEPSTSLFQNEIDDDDSSANKKTNRMEAVEQAMIVSEVASKLEEHLKKVMKGRGGTRSRKGNAGIVTPPNGSYQKFEMSSRGLITYDDEYKTTYPPTISETDEASIASVTVTEDDVSEQLAVPKQFLVAPVEDVEKVKNICEEIRCCVDRSFGNSLTFQACASVAEFFMSTPPSEDVQCVSKKVLELLSTSSRLAADFHFYRAALNPCSANNDEPEASNLFEERHAVALQRSLEGAASQSDAVREFKIFCVNLIYKLLENMENYGVKEPFSPTVRSNLLHTAETWSKSVGNSA
ncbi:unnamed protein product [Cylindrotheca closterium]|uniref:HSF-type DNA-binding domain-containing protein n=1 Tax=Cylindrotheca closterium TaxID=2856 RepID=A0AAD2JJ19_9STRA|nr:unnamed protein product [Cylindrotheca closterium]